MPDGDALEDPGPCQSSSGFGDPARRQEIARLESGDLLDPSRRGVRETLGAHFSNPVLRTHIHIEEKVESPLLARFGNLDPGLDPGVRKALLA